MWEIITAILFLVIGFVFLVKGADWFVDGAAGLAAKLRIPQLVIGLTIVAFGTSAPELATSIISSSKESVGIAIGNIFPSEWNWHQFWSMTAFLSIILAVMNIIPIPGLDGGHMIFTFWEMVTGRKVSEKVLEIAQYIGMALILALVLFANGNDIYKLFK